MKQHVLKSAVAMICLFAIAMVGCDPKDTEPIPKPEPPTEGLVAYYPFDGNALDESPLANNGSVSGAQLAKDRYNADFSAFYFDGVDDYIEIPSIGAINFGTDQDFAISIWLKYEKTQPFSTHDNNDVLAKWVKNDNTTDGKGYPYCLRVLNQKSSTPGEWYGARFDGPSCSQSGSSSGSDGEVCGDGTWHHLVFLKKSTIISSYIDGEMADQDTDNSNCQTRNDAPLLIGLRHKNGQNAFNGYVDALRIYNRALTEEEIQALFKE